MEEDFTRGNYTWELNKFYLCSMETSYEKLMLKKKWFISALPLEHLEEAKNKRNKNHKNR